ncbi:hypothetical protein [Streptomonospora salina]|uniref:Uncharacterized protein n=1 Tax=Streptomonospora salina TaxID=104205 RepID=A0A841E8U8_9ACTN|nr:hypothetical protein [Streptomonospora salina]MBB5999362.1 hypothetical protein [Streptomonospora salina]
MLRHVIGLLTGAAIAPALWAALGWSAQRVSAAVGGAGFAPLGLTAVGVLMFVGVACGFLAGARVSPLAALFSGGLLLGYALWPVMAAGTVDAALPGWIPDDSVLHPLGPGLLLALPLGTLLFVSGLVPSRWRARNAPRPGDPGPLPADGVPGPRGGHGPEPARPDGPTGAGPDTLHGRGGLGEAPEGDPESTTTPMRRRRIGRPRWNSSSRAPESDTLEFQRGRD